MAKYSVSIDPPTTLKSTSAFALGYQEDTIGVYVQVFSPGGYDLNNYNECYKRRINYWLKNMNSGKIITQGTIVLCTDPNNFDTGMRDYSKAIDPNNQYGDFRLYLESPEGLSSATATANTYKASTGTV